MPTDLEQFVAHVADFSTMPAALQNECLAYYLQAQGKNPVQVSEINDLRQQLLLPKYNTANQFSLGCRNGSGRKARYVKAEKGYYLERAAFQELQNKYGKRPTAVIIKNDLVKHIGALSEPDLKEYLTEASNCFESGYFRAAIVLSWCAGYAILRLHIFTKHLVAFNAVTSSYAKPFIINRIEDFDELKERTVLDAAKSAAILTKEQHKQIVILLDKRNSFAHPSGRKASAPVAEAYLTEIIDEVIARFC